MTSLPVHGGCLCGRLRFELSQGPTFACHCHCHSCQRASGAAYVTWATFPADSFTMTSGSMTEHQSSPGVRRGHCSECGTSITYRHADRAGDVDVTAASFDDSSFVTPRAHIWLEDKLLWVEINDELPKYRRRVG